MSFLFKACFEPQLDHEDFCTKEYHPKVDLLPEEAQPQRTRVREQRQPTTVANKLRARGNFDKPNMQKDYDGLALETELYREFLAAKRADQRLWGVTFQDYQSQMA
jgi:hypothetical protein